MIAQRIPSEISDMGKPQPLFLPEPADSSAKALIPLQKSSSSPTAAIDSPTQLSPSSPTATAAPSPPHPSSPPVRLAFPSLSDRFDLSSSSSSSSNLVPEISNVPDNDPSKTKHRRLKRRTRHGELKENEKWQQPRPPDKAHSREPHQTGCQGNVCCKCAAGLTADCAAVCCCPLAVFHLLALTFIKLPSTVAWRVFVNIKKKLCHKRPSDVHEIDSPRPNLTPSWSYRESPEHSDPLAHVVRLDSQNLWKHFEAGHLGFGGLSIKRD